MHICVDLAPSRDEVERALIFIREQLGNEVASRWYQIGVIIGVPVAALENIRANPKNTSVEDYEQAMLKQWLGGHALLPKTWQVLVDAVRHKAGGDYPVLAEGLSKNIATHLQG